MSGGVSLLSLYALIRFCCWVKCLNRSRGRVINFNPCDNSTSNHNYEMTADDVELFTLPQGSARIVGGSVGASEV
jgi:hypothetical protein